MFAVSDAARILRAAGPEEGDAELLEKVKAFGFPHWVAARIFRQVLGRYAPMFCKGCGVEFTPRSPFTMERQCCHPCAKGPETEEGAIKNRARRLAMQALNKGKIKREPCTVCGRSSAHMHHPDYSRPVHVVFLCVRCHAAEHKTTRVSRATI